MDAKRAEILTLRQTVSNLQSLGFGGGRQPKSKRVTDKKRGGKQRSGGQDPPVDLAYS